MFETLFSHDWFFVAGELLFGLSFCTFVVAGVVTLVSPTTVPSRRRRR